MAQLTSPARQVDAQAPLIGSSGGAPGRRRSSPTSTTIEIVGEPGSTVPVTRYIDAALGHAGFRAWVERQARPRHWDTFATYWPNGSGDYPRDPRYERATAGAVDIGMVVGNGRRREVTIDTTTLEVLGGRVDGDLTDVRRPEIRDIARTRGWTLGEAQAHLAAGDEVGRIAAEIADLRPDIFVGSSLATEPGGAPSLYIKGNAPAFVRERVADALVPIRIVDEQPYSFDELERRKLAVHDALIAMGYEQVSTSVNITGKGRIPAVVLMTPGLPADPSVILQSLPAALRSSVDLLVHSEAFVGEDRASAP